MKIHPATIEGALLWGAVMLTVTTVLMLAIGRATRQRSGASEGTLSEHRRLRLHFVGQVAQIIVLVLGVIVYFHLVPVLRPVGTALLASAGVLTVVAGVAAQGTLGSIFSGVSLLLYRPFRAGDRIQMEGPEGVVTGVIETINLGYTTLATDKNHRVVIPNSQMSTATILNLTSVDPRHLVTIPITVDYGTDLDEVRTVIHSAVTDYPAAEGIEEISVTDLTAFGVTLTAYVWTPHASANDSVVSHILEATAQACGTKMNTLAARAAFLPREAGAGLPPR